MKILKIFLVLSLAITISYFSWSYYTSKSLLEKHERATLVLKSAAFQLYKSHKEAYME